MTEEKRRFVAQFGQAVRAATRGTGVFPSVAMAQMILESSGRDADGVFRIGRGLVARRANNYFGIKADRSWTGPTVTLPTPNDAQPYSKFRVYDSVQDSIRDHVAFLQRNSRYTNAGVFDANTPGDQALALDAAGYAGDSPSGAYARNLFREIYGNDLTFLDDRPNVVAGLAVGAAVMLLGGYAAHRAGLLHLPSLTKLLP